jgi:hypothetical protein
MKLGTARSKKLRHAHATPSARRGERAYTVVEILMSMAVLAVGVSGIIAMQDVTLASNLHAKNLAIATHIAQAWMGILDAEAALWGTTGSFSRTTWLQRGAGEADWFRPDYDDTRFFGPAFDALGNPVADLDQDPNARFCVDLRMTPLTTDNTGGGMIRVEVRVIWLRSQAVLGGLVLPQVHACGLPAVEVAEDNERRLFHFVFMAGAVRQVGI